MTPETHSQPTQSQPTISRGQSSVELLIILAVSLTILSALVSFTTEHVSNVQKQQSVDSARDSVNRLVREINQVYLSGPGNVRDVVLPFPSGIDASNSLLSNNSIILRVYGTDVSASAIPALQGSVPTSQGLIRIRLISYANYVAISLVSVVSDTDTIYVATARDSNESFTVTLTNFNSSIAISVLSLAWSHSHVGAALSSSSITLLPGESESFDIDFNAGATAYGNYVGTLTVSSSVSGSVEQISIPINVEVFAPAQTLLTAIPSTLEFTTLGADANVQTLQLCNSGSTAIKDVSFTISSSSPGSWVSPISTISQINPSSCQNVDVTLTVPSGTSAGNYSGSLTITDYTGANNTTLGINSIVQTMNNYFTWDWSGAQALNNDVSDFKVSNTHATATIKMDKITIRGWSSCDSAQAEITTFALNGSTLYSGGSATDNEEFDITNHDIDSLTTHDTGNTITFSKTISDENEQFLPAVEFTDGSIYTGSVFGEGCVVDSIPPGPPASLSGTMGSSAESVLLSFTFPGDDNQTGSVSSVDIRYSTTDINSQSSFNAANSASYTGSILAAGNVGTQLIDDLNVGNTYYFSIQFYDDANNPSALPTAARARPRNTFRYSLGDFNIAPFAFSRSNPSAGQLDVNEFRVRSLAGSGDRNIVIRVADDANSENAWIVTFGVMSGLPRVNNIRVWYPTPNVPGIPGTAPQYQANPNAPTAGTFDFLSTALINSEYRFNGAYVNIPNPSRLYIDWFSNFTDGNVIFDQTVT